MLRVNVYYLHDVSTEFECSISCISTISSILGNHLCGRNGHLNSVALGYIDCHWQYATAYKIGATARAIRILSLTLALTLHLYSDIGSLPFGSVHKLKHTFIHLEKKEEEKENKIK